MNERGFLRIFPMFGSLILSVIVSSTNMSIVNSFASEKMGWIAASSTWAVVGDVRPPYPAFPSR